MSYPKRKDLFVEWSKAMVEGSTVDKPRYRGTRKANKGRAKPQRPTAHRMTMRKNRKRKKNG